jgi:hypothetical protein
MTTFVHDYGQALRWLVGVAGRRLEGDDPRAALYAGKIAAFVLYVLLALPAAAVIFALPQLGRDIVILAAFPAVGLAGWAAIRLGERSPRPAFSPAIARRLAELGLAYAAFVGGLALVT